MSSSIDSIRRAARLRRTARIESDRAAEAHEAERPGLPVPIEVPQAIPHATSQRAEPPTSGGAVFDAQLIGQVGARRGLRAGPVAIDNASATYNRIEYSGANDRRARKGRITKTEI